MSKEIKDISKERFVYVLPRHIPEKNEMYYAACRKLAGPWGRNFWPEPKEEE